MKYLIEYNMETQGKYNIHVHHSEIQNVNLMLPV